MSGCRINDDDGTTGGLVLEEDTRIKVNVETQTFRFIPGIPINHDDAVKLAKGIKSGPWVVISHKEPRATFVIEESGSVLVHGIARVRSCSVSNARTSSKPRNVGRRIAL